MISWPWGRCKTPLDCLSEHKTQNPKEAETERHAAPSGGVPSNRRDRDLHRSRKPRLAGHFSSPHSHATPIGHNEHDASPSALEPQAHIGQGEEGAGRKPHPILHSTRSPIDSRPTVTLTVRPMSDVRVCYGSHPVSAVAEAACQHVRLSSATAGPGVPRSRQNLVVLVACATESALPLGPQCRCHI